MPHRDIADYWQEKFGKNALAEAEEMKRLMEKSDQIEAASLWAKVAFFIREDAKAEK